jgi:hypothetical protein
MVNQVISTNFHIISGSFPRLTGLARDDPRIHFAQILGMVGMPRKTMGKPWESHGLIMKNHGNAWLGHVGKESE